MRKPAFALMSIAAVVWVAAGCAHQSQSSPAGEASTNTAPKQDAASVPAAPAQPAGAPRSDTLEILSVLSVEHAVDLLAQRDGAVVEISFDQDSSVKQGDVLARLDDRELAAKLRNAQLELEVAQNNLKYAQAQRKALLAAYSRQQELRKYGLSSEAALEEAEFKANGAGFDEDSWSATVEQKKAEITELEIELEKTRIVAPFGGFVVRRSIRVGQNVLKNDLCFRLSQLAPLEVRFLVPESAGDRPQAGDALSVLPASDNAHAYQARVRLVSPTVDPGSGSYDVTAQLGGAGLDRLRPGMSVKVDWPLHSRQPAH